KKKIIDDSDESSSDEAKSNTKNKQTKGKGKDKNKKTSQLEMHETSSEEETVEDLDSDEYIETKGKKKIASGGQTQTNKKPSKGKASPVKRATNKDQIVYHTDSDESSDGDASDFKSAFAKRNTLVKA
ncbi:hypothetical protein ScalyP_jg163, partial [Parmales sp. scaly parma]